MSRGGIPAPGIVRSFPATKEPLACMGPSSGYPEIASWAKIKRTAYDLQLKSYENGDGESIDGAKPKLGRRMKGLSVALALIGGAWMRLWMLKALPQISPDTLLYGGMAKNMLLHGQFAITDGSGVVHETLIRLPGYPLFLALCFRLFGIDNYNAVSYIQIGLELAGCLLLADFVRRIAPAGINEGAAQGRCGWRLCARSRRRMRWRR
jgi:hypothetical protein